jgi:hypothetical protein
MMKKNKNIIYPLLAIVLFFHSCGDKEKDPTPEEKFELLTAKKWKHVSVKQNGVNVSLDDFGGTYRDLRWQFKTDLTFSIITVAADQTPNVLSGTYEFLDNGTRIYLRIHQGPTENWYISELRKNILKAKYKRNDFAGGTTDMDVVMQYAD